MGGAESQWLHYMFTILVKWGRGLSLLCPPTSPLETVHMHNSDLVSYKAEFLTGVLSVLKGRYIVSVAFCRSRGFYEIIYGSC